MGHIRSPFESATLNQKGDLSPHFAGGARGQSQRDLHWPADRFRHKTCAGARSYYCLKAAVDDIFGL